jgi:hypothetical protein
MAIHDRAAISICVRSRGRVQSAVVCEFVALASGLLVMSTRVALASPGAAQGATRALDGRLWGEHDGWRYRIGGRREGRADDGGGSALRGCVTVSECQLRVPCTLLCFRALVTGVAGAGGLARSSGVNYRTSSPIVSTSSTASLHFKMDSYRQKP